MTIEKDTVGVLDKALKLATPIVETGCGLIQSLLGKPCEIAGGLLADKIYAWRWARRIEIANKAEQLLDKHKIDVRILPEGFLLPLLDAAGDIDNPELQDLWAHLLSSGVKDDDFQDRRFLETLKQLNQNEAKLLSIICQSNFRFEERIDFDVHTGVIIKKSVDDQRLIFQHLNCGSDQLLSYLTHLSSLGIICTTSEIDVVWDLPESSHRRKLAEKHFLYAQPTPYGHQFLQACCDWDYDASKYTIRPWQQVEEAKSLAVEAHGFSSEAYKLAETAEENAQDATYAAEDAASTAVTAQDAANLAHEAAQSAFKKAKENESKPANLGY